MTYHPAHLIPATEGRTSVRVRRTPNALHAYTATVRGEGTYGWGNTPAEAREKLAQNLAKIEAERGPTEGRTYAIPVVTDAELAEMSARAAKWVLTPAQAKAIDGRAGLLVRPDDSESDPYFTRRF